MEDREPMKDIMIGCFGHYVQERKKERGTNVLGERLDISDDGLVTGIHPPFPM